MINLIHGEALEEMNKLIKNGIKVDCIICDIPYGTTKNKWDSVIPFDDMWNCLKQLRKEPQTPILLFSDMPFTIKLVESNIEEWRYTIYWDKEIGTGFLNSSWQPLKVIEEIQVFIETPYKQVKSKENYKSVDRVAKYNPQFTVGNENHKKGQMHLFKENTNNNYNSFVSLPDDIVKETAPCGSLGSGYDDAHNKNIGFSLKTKEGEALKHPKNLITISKGKSDKHPTQKPIKLLEYLINTYSDVGDTVLDFTMGSGTTGIACRNLKRNFIGIELEEKYFNIAKERIEYGI